MLLSSKYPGWTSSLVTLAGHGIDYKDLGPWLSRRLWLYVSSHYRDVMTSSNGNIFRVTGPFMREIHRSWWIPLKMSIDAELWCFLWSAPGLWPMDCGQFDWSLYPVSNHATCIPKVRWPFIFHWWKSLYIHVYLNVRLVTFIAATCLLMRISNTFIHIFSLGIFAEVLLKKIYCLAACYW